MNTSNNSWKNQSGSTVGRNVLFNNLNYNNGIFRYKDNKLIHKNSNSSTIVGIGTEEPVSRLSFGNSKVVNNLSVDSTFAVHEKKDGSEKVGMAFYENLGDNLANNNSKYGLRLIVSDPETVQLPNKLIITNDGRFFVNQEPYTNSATFDIKGSLKTSNTITVGNEQENTISDFGAIRYVKTTDIDGNEGIGSLQIKNRPSEVGDEQWSKLLYETSSSSFWSSKTNGIYKIENVSIKNKEINSTVPPTKHALSIEGNITVGNALSTLSKEIENLSGVMLLKENLHIGDFNTSLEVKYNPDCMLSMYSTMNKCFINAGLANTVKDSEKSVVFGDNNKIYDFNFTFGDSNTSYGKFNLNFGENNNITGSKSNFAYVFGLNNTSNSKFSFINGRECNINTNITTEDSTNQVIFGYKNYIHDLSYWDKLDNFKNTAIPQGMIFGNNNKILSNVNAIKLISNTGAYKFSNTSGVIFGKSNKIQGKDTDINSFVIGDSNECYHSGIIIGNNNRHGWKSMSEIVNFTNKENINLLNNFVIGNNIDNNYPWKHSGWNDYNLVPGITKDKIHDQPPILFTVGQANGDKTFDSNKGTFTVDTAGNVRCNNIILKNPKSGICCTRVIDAQEYSVNNNKFAGVNHYCVQGEIFTALTNELVKFNVNESIPKVIIPVPYKGRLVKIISILNVPNISYNYLIDDINKNVMFEINTYGGTFDDPITYQLEHKHEMISRRKDGVWVDNGKSMDEAKIENKMIQINISDNQKHFIQEKSYIEIKTMDDYHQKGYVNEDEEHPNFLKAKLLFIIEKII